MSKFTTLDIVYQADLYRIPGGFTSDDQEKSRDSTAFVIRLEQHSISIQDNC